MASSDHVRIGFLGAGKMATALGSGWLKAGLARPEDLLASDPVPQILLIGCGQGAAMISPALRQALRAAGAVIDAMDTGAACRTYNVLLAEERRVAAALIAVE